ncbi:MauE/DoxX family redox-associated membrane protein [Nonomuraea sp. NPDC023979]|uniref:MauE/DoxX family redox-associated membrane protein n=1 Tax=Nonomuraea sp. NPDC023979 TaxID=3154796 RepID=UPI0033D1B3A9
MAYALLSCQVLIGAVFAVAALTKLRDPAAFAASVAALRLVPRGVASLAAGAVAVAEASVAALMFLPRAGFALAAALLLGFCAVIVKSRRSRVECRCFGAASGPLGPAHLVRNGLLLAVAALGWAAVSAVPAVPAVHPDATAGGLAVAAFAGVAGAALLIVLPGNVRSV